MRVLALYRLLGLSGVLLGIVGCQRQSASVPQAPRPVASLAVTVDGQKAYELAAAQVAIGPRYAGSEGARQTAEWIVARAREQGLKATIDEWTEETAHGPVTFRNVLATLPGRGRGYVIVGSHFDTKVVPGVPDFAGANDGASSTALLIELMRCLQAGGPWQGPELRFLFFDGEECRVKYGPGDGLHGSRRVVTQLQARGELSACRAMLLCDLIGDRDLRLTIPPDNDAALRRRIVEIARAQGTARHFGFHRGSVLDDHTPFQEAGVPCLNLIDFDYGPQNSWWHSAQDTMDKLAPESFEIVGNAMLALLYDFQDTH